MGMVTAWEVAGKAFYLHAIFAREATLGGDQQQKQADVGIPRNGLPTSEARATNALRQFTICLAREQRGPSGLREQEKYLVPDRRWFLIVSTTAAVP